MIKKARKKPVEIEFIEWDGSQRCFEEINEWSPNIKGIEFETGVVGITTMDNVLIIPTFEGDMCVNKGDMIIKGVVGEFYPCKPDIFKQTYEIIGIEKQSDNINEK